MPQCTCPLETHTCCRIRWIKDIFEVSCAILGIRWVQCHYALGALQMDFSGESSKKRSRFKVLWMWGGGKEGVDFQFWTRIEVFHIRGLLSCIGLTTLVRNVYYELQWWHNSGHGRKWMCLHCFWFTSWWTNDHNCYKYEEGTSFQKLGVRSSRAGLLTDSGKCMFI